MAFIPSHRCTLLLGSNYLDQITSLAKVLIHIEPVFKIIISVAAIDLVSFRGGVRCFMLKETGVTRENHLTSTSN